MVNLSTRIANRRTMASPEPRELPSYKFREKDLTFESDLNGEYALPNILGSLNKLKKSKKHPLRIKSPLSFNRKISNKSHEIKTNNFFKNISRVTSPEAKRITSQPLIDINEADGILRKVNAKVNKVMVKRNPGFRFRGRITAPPTNAFSPPVRRVKSPLTQRKFFPKNPVQKLSIRETLLREFKKEKNSNYLEKMFKIKASFQ